MHGRARRIGISTAILLLCTLLVSTLTSATKGPRPTGPLLMGGVAGEPGALQIVPTDAPARPPTAAERAWLDAGHVPGDTAARRDMAERALRDLRLLTRPDGAVTASWHSFWSNVWPRDGSWVAAAYTATGHPDDALLVLRHLAGLQRADGTWEARYTVEGIAPDRRPAQQDGGGWMPWAVWFWYVAQDPNAPATRAGLAELWPAVRAAADRVAGSLQRSGLPPAGPDYWETRTDQITLGTAAPLLAGLRASADLARRMGDPAATRWSAAASRLDTGIRTWFGAYGYQRTPSSSGGEDSAVTWLGPPFAGFDAKVDSAVRRTADRLTLPNGGILPGLDWAGDPSTAWTPETASFALYDAASGHPAAAARRLDWLAAHRTAYGSLPEKVAADGTPASVAPLAWTGAAVLLALVATERALPAPPA
ncbi:hypothetical protein [Embleya sp. NPDC050493]|uniref:hypothetical protein n=1 Tax=Embleya sp. NPDC050493 TaxID=3363989 RepID=UPI0037B63592